MTQINHFHCPSTQTETIKILLRSDLILYGGHHALLAVVDRFGNSGRRVIHVHRHAVVAAHRDLQAGHLLNNLLRGLREQKHREAPEHSTFTETKDGCSYGVTGHTTGIRFLE